MKPFKTRKAAKIRVPAFLWPSCAVSKPAELFLALKDPLWDHGAFGGEKETSVQPRTGPYRAKAAVQAWKQHRLAAKRQEPWFWLLFPVFKGFQYPWGGVWNGLPTDATVGLYGGGNRILIVRFTWGDLQFLSSL